MKYEFPQPRRLGGSTRWSPTELQAWEQQQKIILPAFVGMANVRQLAARYGVSVPTIWRWAQASRKKANGGK